MNGKIQYIYIIHRGYSSVLSDISKFEFVVFEVALIITTTCTNA